MNLNQFWCILWARRWITIFATIGFALGASIVVAMVTPRWEAHSRILLNLLKPDPITGDIVNSDTSTYVASQVQLITDYSVAGLAADRMGMENDLELLAKYHARSQNDHRDFHHWLAQQIIDNTKADVVAGSNILEITYTDKTADRARDMANTLRQSFFDFTLYIRRSQASRSADWFTHQATEEKNALSAAEKSESAYSRENDVYMATDTMDVDSARLAALATLQGGTSQQLGGSSSANLQLVEVDAEIAQATQTLGPNHPQLQALRAKRAALAAASSQERAFLTPSAREKSPTGALNAAATAVTDKHEKLAHLKELHSEVLVRRELYNKTLARAAELRQQAAVTDIGMTRLGPSFVPPAPAFPKKIPILVGALIFGVGFGVLTSLLIELLNRKIRSHDDLEWATQVPLLAIIPLPLRAN